MIDFSRIEIIVPDMTGETAPEIPPVLDAYDSVWGFITVKQDITFDYSDSQYNYDSPVTVSINGIFSINAERGAIETPDGLHDEDNFKTLQAKYDALRDLFMSACRQSAPEELLNYGTQLDLRCMKLPSILKDEDGNGVYMRPFSLNINETQWAKTISYTAVFKEVQKPACKIAVSGYIINDAVIDIVARRPRTSIEKFAFAHGGDIFFTGWEPRQYKLSGELSGIVPSGCAFSDVTLGLANSLMSGRVSFNTVSPGIAPSGVFSDLLVSSSDFSVSKSGTGTSISIEGRE